MNDNRRRFTRIPTDNTAVLLVEGKEIPIEIKDISFKGLLTYEIPNMEMAKGIKLQLYWFLCEDLPALLINGEVCWKKSPYIGIEFTNFPAETAGQLYRFLELNLGTEELFDRELEQLFQENSSN